MIDELLIRAAAAQLRPRQWGAIHTGIAVGYKAAPDSGSIHVADLMRHQQRLTDLIADLAAAVKARHEVLVMVEWEGHDAISRCPSCEATARRGDGADVGFQWLHEPGCALAALIGGEVRS